MTHQIRIGIDVRGHLEAARKVRGGPRIVNAELNRGYKGIGGSFMRRFARERLSGGTGIRVRRKTGRKGSGPQPSVPGKARALGFTARITDLKTIHGKRLRMGARGPVPYAHEVGLTIRAKRREGLTIRARKGRRRGEVVAIKRQVRLPSRLGFFDTFSSFRGELGARLFKMWNRVEERFEKGV